MIDAVATATTAASGASTTTVAAVIAAFGSVIAALIAAATSWRAQSYDRLLKDIRSAIDETLRSAIEKLIETIDKRG